MTKSNSGKRVKPVKQYIKFLSIYRDPITRKTVVQKAPESVIKAICNASYNVTHGDVKLTPTQKKKFKSQIQLLSKLNNRDLAIPAKRKVLVQKGGIAILPILLSAILPALGSLLFSK